MLCTRTCGHGTTLPIALLPPSALRPDTGSDWSAMPSLMGRIAVGDDFQVGDVVVCVDDSPYRSRDVKGKPWPMAKGSTWRVSDVLVARLGPLAGQVLLRFHAEPPLSRAWKRGWYHARFRKLSKADEQFTEQMRQCKPHRNRVPA